MQQSHIQETTHTDTRSSQSISNIIARVAQQQVGTKEFFARFKTLVNTAKNLQATLLPAAFKQIWHMYLEIHKLYADTRATLIMRNETIYQQWWCSALDATQASTAININVSTTDYLILMLTEMHNALMTIHSLDFEYILFHQYIKLSNQLEIQVLQAVNQQSINMLSSIHALHTSIMPGREYPSTTSQQSANHYPPVDLTESSVQSLDAKLMDQVRQLQNTILQTSTMRDAKSVVSQPITSPGLSERKSIKKRKVPDDTPLVSHQEVTGTHFKPDDRKLLDELQHLFVAEQKLPITTYDPAYSSSSASSSSSRYSFSSAFSSNSQVSSSASSYSSHLTPPRTGNVTNLFKHRRANKPKTSAPILTGQSQQSMKISTETTISSNASTAGTVKSSGLSNK